MSLNSNLSLGELDALNASLLKGSPLILDYQIMATELLSASKQQALNGNVKHNANALEMELCQVKTEMKNAPDLLESIIMELTSEIAYSELEESTKRLQKKGSIHEFPGITG
jgi:hypothetical protein